MFNNFVSIGVYYILECFELIKGRMRDVNVAENYTVLSSKKVHLTILHFSIIRSWTMNENQSVESVATHIVTI